MAGVVVAGVEAVVGAAEEAELEVATVEWEPVGEQGVAVGMAVGMVTAVSPRGIMMAPAGALPSVLVGGRRSPRRAVSIAPTPQPDASRPRLLEGRIRQVE